MNSKRRKLEALSGTSTFFWRLTHPPHPPSGGMGRDVVEGGEGGGGGAPPRVPLWSLPKAGQKFFSLNPLGTEGAEAKNFGCQPQKLEGEEGGLSLSNGLPRK